MNEQEKKLPKQDKLIIQFDTSGLKVAEKKIALISGISEIFGNLTTSLHQHGEYYEKQTHQKSLEFHNNFHDELQRKTSNREKLTFTCNEINRLNKKIAEAKIQGDRLNEKLFHGILHNVVLPFKNQLQDKVRLDNEVGPLSTYEMSGHGIEVDPSIVNKLPGAEKPYTAGIPDAEPILNQVAPYDWKEPQPAAEINIPVTLKDKPLKTFSGKPLNNSKHIKEGRRFIWKDDRIPDLLAQFLLEKECIFDYQLEVVAKFFRTTKCDRKIVFHGNANQLTSILYDLKQAKYTSIFNLHLGEVIESIFVKKDNTFQALITKKSLIADLKPGNITRRVKAGSPQYLDILSYLSEKLKTVE